MSYSLVIEGEIGARPVRVGERLSRQIRDAFWSPPVIEAPVVPCKRRVMPPARWPFGGRYAADALA